MKVLLERFPYRYVESGVLENGHPDYRIQKAHHYTKRYSDMYLLDNQMQLLTAMDDFEYTKWLDPEGVPCYVRDYWLLYICNDKAYQKLNQLNYG